MNHHLVQFYEAEVFLIKGLADYIGNAISSGNTAIAIATAEHLHMLEKTQAARGLLDQRGQAMGGAYLPLQADQMLPLFMQVGMPDEDRFRNAIGGVIRDAAAHGGNDIHVFGEMVAILCATSHCSLQSAGKHDAAIRVERYFLNLQRHFPFSLLCAYPLNAFPSANDAFMFNEVCALHSHVLPAEGFDPSGNPGRCTAISPRCSSKPIRCPPKCTTASKSSRRYAKSTSTG